ncbi:MULTISPECIES: sirohydrochlorin chelatase [Geobacillus]|uniref:Sirohydrochlorin ferrochelatase n=1 Tax=Geobacillus proteiniphilus TaxID=860353 RepID=A0A1Q5T6E9_9BACL|nr:MULTISPECIES: sirohydrochlorin chelatase [Geobacillus]KDE50252.1 sirohydrochlorin ferrochelatase [Geobacillus sp. CAMR5420]OKO95813.1 Sirohydrochlorin ferrochelatase [Geobacillus proteiniphilus]OPX03354.1 sirohydrochlorin chelatase [Geobacillus sp. LEMMY01]
MEAVLYVSHGSRIAAARHEAARFVEQCRRTIDIPIQELCFVELAEPDIVTGVDRCVAQGATRVIVVPLLLLSAGHAKHDIPAALDIARRRHPSVDILCGAPFGVHETMIDIIIDRISEQSAPLDGESMILLVGRGSSDPDTKRDMSAIAALLKEKTNVPHVDVCFLAAIRPTLDEGLERAHASAYRRVFVVPYLLFTGVLMKTIERKLQGFSVSDKQWRLCSYLGYHPRLVLHIQQQVSSLSSVKKGA